MNLSLQPLLARLDHLSEQFRELREGVRKAIRIADEDPEMALTRTRKVLEYVVRDVYQRRCGEPPGTRPLETLLQRLVKDGHFPDRLDAYATGVRKLGNVGTHSFGEGITTADVYQSLTQLMPILEWYFEVERREAAIPATAPVPLETDLERLRRELIAEGQQRREGDRKAVVGLRFLDVSEVFKDRAEILAQLRCLLTDAAVKLVCVVGRGGIGKTALLSKVCAEIENNEFRLSATAAGMGVDGIVYVSCRKADRPTLERLFHDISRILGDSTGKELLACWADPSRSLEDKIHYLLSRLRSGYYLVVLDNLEDGLAADHSLADPGLRAFVDVCVSTPHALRLLGSSREPLLVARQGGRAARTVLLNSGLPAADAVALLRDLDPDGFLGLRDAPEKLLGQMVARCYGIPRALETIAGILESDPTLTPSQLAASAALFTGQVVENLIAEHYRQVTDSQRRVLDALAVYGKAVPVAAVRFLLEPFFPEADVAEGLRALVRNFFVTFHRGPDTYELHPLDQEHAYDQLPQTGSFNRQACHLRAADFFRELRKPRQEWQALPDLLPQLDEFEQRTRANAYDQAYELLNEIDFHYLAIWGHSELITSLRARLVGRLSHPLQEIGNQRQLGYAYNRLCATEEALLCFETALRLAEAVPDDSVWRFDLKGNLGRSLLRVGRINEAVSLLEQALVGAREVIRTTHGLLGRNDEGVWLGSLGEAYQLLGRGEEAVSCFLSALQIARNENYLRWQVGNLGRLGDAYRQHGDIEKAEHCLREGLDLACRTGNRQGEGFCALFLGKVFHDIGELAPARTWYERGLEMGLPPTNYSCAVNLGTLCLEEGKRTEAWERMGQGVAICRTLLQKTPRFFDALYALALALLASGQSQEGLNAYQQAFSICSAGGVLQDVLQRLRLLQRAVGAMPGLEQALEGLRHAFRANGTLSEWRG